LSFHHYRTAPIKKRDTDQLYGISSTYGSSRKADTNKRQSLGLHQAVLIEFAVCNSASHARWFCLLHTLEFSRARSAQKAGHHIAIPPHEEAANCFTGTFCHQQSGYQAPMDRCDTVTEPLLRDGRCRHSAGS
jgi:hypothetical protein